MSEQELARIGQQWNAARGKQRALATELHQALRDFVAEGHSEYEAARIAGVDRMTVRRALGKR